MENLENIGLVELNEKSLEDTNGGVQIGIGIELTLNLENPFGLAGILESILGSVEVGAGGEVGVGG